LPRAPQLSLEAEYRRARRNAQSVFTVGKLLARFIALAHSPNTDAIEEIQVLSLGALADYGNLAGAVFNVVHARVPAE